MWFVIYIHCERTTRIEVLTLRNKQKNILKLKLILSHIFPLFLCVLFSLLVRIFKFYSFGKFHLHNIVLPTTVTSNPRPPLFYCFYKLDYIFSMCKRYHAVFVFPWLISRRIMPFSIIHCVTNDRIFFFFFFRLNNSPSGLPHFLHRGLSS